MSMSRHDGCDAKIAAILGISLLAIGIAASGTVGGEPPGLPKSKSASDQGDANVQGDTVAAQASESAGQQVQDVATRNMLQFAKEAYDRIDQDVRDYTCVMIGRERVDGKLGGYRYVQAKVRHARLTDDGTKIPFSVYLRFLRPESVAGREVLFVQDGIQNELIARRGGRRNANMTFRLSRDSSLAMEGNRYPVTEIGFKTLSLRLVEVLQQELGRDEAEIKTYSNAKVNGQPCDFFRMTYLKRRADSPYHIVEVSFDKERQIPFYFRSFGWLAELDREAALLEEYFFNRIQTNVGLTDADFDARNPDYQFDEPQQDAATGFAETEHAAESDLDRMPE